MATALLLYWRAELMGCTALQQWRVALPKYYFFSFNGLLFYMRKKKKIERER
jgi:hypothetical protein